MGSNHTNPLMKTKWLIIFDTHHDRIKHEKAEDPETFRLLQMS